jgi:hypothetical protein
MTVTEVAAATASNDLRSSDMPILSIAAFRPINSTLERIAKWPGNAIELVEPNIYGFWQPAAGRKGKLPLLAAAQHRGG